MLRGRLEVSEAAAARVAKQLRLARKGKQGLVLDEEGNISDSEDRENHFRPQQLQNDRSAGAREAQLEQMLKEARAMATHATEQHANELQWQSQQFKRQLQQMSTQLHAMQQRLGFAEQQQQQQQSPLPPPPPPPQQQRDQWPAGGDGVKRPDIDDAASASADAQQPLPLGAQASQAAVEDSVMSTDATDLMNLMSADELQEVLDSEMFDVVMQPQEETEQASAPPARVLPSESGAASSSSASSSSTSSSSARNLQCEMAASQTSAAERLEAARALRRSVNAMLGSSSAGSSSLGSTSITVTVQHGRQPPMSWKMMVDQPRETFDAPAFQQQLAILTGLQAHLISVTVHEQGK